MCAGSYFLSDCSVYCDKDATCNGHGDCDDDGNCVCSWAYSGVACKSVQSWIIVLSVVIGLILLVIVGFGVAIGVKKYKARQPIADDEAPLIDEQYE